MNKFLSVASISSPEFINLQPMDINPLMSACDIKVLYIGKNRNGSVITKEVATEMAKTLRGAPIVGYYKKNKEDFRDHGEQTVIEGGQVTINKLTKPYGFVAPNAEVWFQDFEDEDPVNGGTVTRTYLMTTGYLWTGQYEEAQQIIDDGGKPHSMELDKKSLQGGWTNDPITGVEFFIINDAIFSALCALGDDVEPCFEGSAIIPKVETKIEQETPNTFCLEVNQDFANALFTMMKELKETLQGGTDKVETNETNFNQADESTEAVVEQPTTETPAAESTPENSEASAENFEKSVDNSEQNAPAENDNNIEGENSEFEKKEDKEDKEEKADFEKKEEEDKEEEKAEDDKEEEKKEEKEKYSLLQEEYTQLQDKYSALESEVKELREFKLSIDNKAKDDLINEFFMLSEEDKKDVIEHKADYSLDEIKSKLAVICYEKKVTYVNPDSEEQPATNFTLNMAQPSSDKPEWLEAVDSYIEQHK